MCFSTIEFLGIHSVFHKQKFVSFFANNSLNNYYDRYYDILQTVAYNLQQYCFKTMFFNVFSILKVIVI